MWGCFDYSQQEPRILVHFASLMKLEGTGTIVDAYNEGSADFHQMIADMAGIDRKQAKTINLGIMYGMGQRWISAIGLHVKGFTLVKENANTRHGGFALVSSASSSE